MGSSRDGGGAYRFPPAGTHAGWARHATSVIAGGSPRPVSMGPSKFGICHWRGARGRPPATRRIGGVALSRDVVAPCRGIGGDGTVHVWSTDPGPRSIRLLRPANGTLDPLRRGVPTATTRIELPSTTTEVCAPGTSRPVTRFSWIRGTISGTGSAFSPWGLSVTGEERTAQRFKLWEVERPAPNRGCLISDGGLASQSVSPACLDGGEWG